MSSQAVRESHIREQAFLRLGAPLDPVAFVAIERRLHLSFNKWDTQVGDTAVLSSQPVIIPRGTWTKLQRIAEDLAAEVQRRELQVREDEHLQKYIGIPRALRAVLAKLRQRAFSTVRTMRFDFHPTATGWRVSEVNADVPGGWREATSLPELFAAWYPGLGLPGSPLAAWCDAVRGVARNGHVALLSAPGFLEDLQVVYAFQRELAERGTKSFLIQSPGALDWSRGRCYIRSSGFEISAIIRFYQLEWLARLSRVTRWQDLLLSNAVLVINPTTAAISESKRFPLAFGDMGQTWGMFVSESCDPRLVDGNDWDNWVLKAAYSNTGDEIHFCSDVPENRRRYLVGRAQRNPFAWVAQRRFDTIPLDSELGPLFPCVGVFVINGRAIGGYARLSKTRIIDGAAREAPILIDEDEHTSYEK